MIMTALLPARAARHVDHDDAGFRSLTAEGLRSMALLLVPATAAYLVLGPALIETMLQRGVMSGASSELVAQVLAMFAIGLLPFSAFLLFLRGFYALQDARTPMYLNVAGNAYSSVAGFSCFSIFVSAFGCGPCVKPHGCSVIIPGWMLSREKKSPA